MDEESGVGQEWADYAAIQEQIRKRPIIDHKTWACEDKAEAILKAVAERSVPAEVEQRDRWLNNLEANRRKKHRNRTKILVRYAWDLTVSIAVRNQLDQLLEVERLTLIRKLTSAQEFRILYRRAADHGYRAIARDEQLTVAAVKTKVCRCRQRLQARISAFFAPG